jgi:F0F1-type ATP synthase assembly protein I
MATSRDNNKEDAKFLIDQFNKFAAWRIAERQFEFSSHAVRLALIAVLISILAVSWAASKPSTYVTLVIAGVITGILIAIMVVYLLFISCDYRKFSAEDDDDASRLLILEEHYSRFESLPHITLEKIMDFKPEDLKKYLKENEPRVDTVQTG